MSMCGHYLRILPEKLKELQSQPEVFKEFLYLVMSPECLQVCKERYCFLNWIWDDLHTFLERLRLPDSLWQRALGNRYSKEIGTKIENFNFGAGRVRFLAPNEVQAIANALRYVSQKAFMNVFRKNYPNREDHCDTVLSVYQEWKQFLQKAAEEGQAVLFWIT